MFVSRAAYLVTIHDEVFHTVGTKSCRRADDGTRGWCSTRAIDMLLHNSSIGSPTAYYADPGLLGEQLDEIEVTKALREPTGRRC